MRPLAPSPRLSVFLFFSLCTSAAERPLTLADTLALTTERHPALTAQAFTERAATGHLEQAAVRPAPTLEASLENVLGTGRVSGVRSLEATVQASQTFERGGKREKRVAVATRERETVAHEFAVRRAELLAATATAYVTAVVAHHRLTLAAEPLQLARATVTALETRARAGAASAIETARARVAVISAESEHARAAAALRSARSALAATWGGELSVTEASTFSPALPLPATLPAEAALRAGLATHPRLALQAAHIAARRATLELAQAHATGDVTASGGVRFLRDGTDAAFVAGFSLPLPARHQNQGNIRAARETLAGAEHTVRAVEAELHAAFTAAWHDLTAAHALAHQLRREALPATTAAHAAVRRAHAEGALPFLDVLETQRALVALHREILDAESAYALALVRLEALTAPTFPLTTALLAP